MRAAVISDVHANLHALEAVLHEVDAESVDELWCLGDTVGYGPRPNECCSLVAARASVALAGNHDLGAIGTVSLEEFSPDAAAAAAWTARVLDDEARRFLTSLATSTQLDDVALAHASPRDPVWEYVLAWDQAADAFARTGKPLVLVGHTHVAMAFTQTDTIQARVVPGGTELELGAFQHVLLNPGSLGQPRDGDPRAAWLLLDLEAQTATFRRTAYAIEQTQAEIAAAGLPEALGERLAEGL